MLKSPILCSTCTVTTHADGKAMSLEGLEINHIYNKDRLEGMKKPLSNEALVGTKWAKGNNDKAAMIAKYLSPYKN